MSNWSLDPLVWLARIRQGSEVCAIVMLLLGAGAVLSLAAMRFDQRELLGVNIWLKPFKFYFSTALYVGTVGWLLTYVDVPAGQKNWVGTIASLMMVGEMVGITLQAVRGERSHFNNSTALNAAIFGAMGLLILVNTILLGWLMWWLFTRNVPLPLGALWGCRLGLLLTILASIEGAYMAQSGAHTVGAPDGGPGWGWLNWSTTAGDLRVSHFIGLHGLQVLPLAGFLLSEAGAGAGIFIVAALHFGAFVLTLLQALARKPLFF